MSEIPSIAFVTLGCPKNEVDSDRMAALAEASAFRVVSDVGDADVVVLNTCSFIQAATEESIDEAFALITEWRPARQGRKVIVSGCMVSRYGTELEDTMPEPDAFLPVADEASLVAVLDRLLDRSSPSASHVAPLRTVPGLTAYLKVSEGCDRRCAYCTIPSIRGPFVSTPVAELLDEARFLISNGARELVLVGQDIASYGRDLGVGEDLASLVSGLDSLAGDFRIRLMYVQPDGITDELLRTVAVSRHVCHYLDIPLQHASADVLRAMHRSGDAQSHLALLARIRGILPDISLRTTVIAGFPGETREQAAELETFLQDAGFDYVGVFAYSPEEGTVAGEMADQIDDETRAERAQRLREIADTVGFARAALQIGTVQRVLVEAEEEGELVGRTCGQAPEVDGMTIIEPEAPLGAFVDVRIIDSVGYELVGVTL